MHPYPGLPVEMMRKLPALGLLSSPYKLRTWVGGTQPKAKEDE